MRLLRSWVPAIIAIIWLGVVQHVAGHLASALCAIGMFYVCIMAFWEAGSFKRDTPHD